MFKHFVLSAICLLFIVSSQAQKVGYINTQELVALMPEVKEANSQLEVMKTQFSKRGQDMLQVLQQKYQTFQQKQANGELSPVEAEKQGQELKAEEQTLVNFEQRCV